MMYLKDITTLEIAEVVDAVKARWLQPYGAGCPDNADRRVQGSPARRTCSPGYNPAQATRQPRNRVIRERLSLEEWKEIYAAAEHHPPYLQCAMLLAVVTGQRIGDISRMKFSDIWDDMLHVEHEKTGAKVALPLSLRCEALNITLREVVAKCRDAVVSKYLVHFRHSTSQATRGDRVSANSITTTFKKPETAPVFYGLTGRLQHFTNSVHCPKDCMRLRGSIRKNYSVTSHLNRRQNTMMTVEKTGRL